MGFLGSAVVKNPPANAGDAGNVGLIPESGRSPGVGNGNPLQYSCLENPRDGGAWWATIYGVAQSWTRLKRLSSLAAGMQILYHLWPLGKGISRSLVGSSRAQVLACCSYLFLRSAMGWFVMILHFQKLNWAKNRSKTQPKMFRIYSCVR